MPYDDEQDDDQQGAVSTIARYLNPDRGDDDNDSGWGSMFKRVAGGPRIKPPAPPAMADPNAMKNAALGGDSTPPVSPDMKGAPGWESAFGDPTSADSSPASSDARNALGEVASATGSGTPDVHTTGGGPGKLVPAGTDPSGRPTLVIKPQSKLDQMPPAPTPPTMDPEFNKTQADLRAKSAVTPKVDPTGQTLDKYKIGAGGRIARAFKDFGMGIARGHGLVGSAGDVVEGAFGDRNAPGYFGKGAVNGQYSRDEQQRQRDVAADQSRIKSFEDENKEATDEFKNKQGAWKDQFEVAKNQDTDAVRDETNRIRDDRAKEIKDKDEKTGNLKDPKQQRADRTKAADDLKLPPGNARNSYILTGKYPDDPTTQQKLKDYEARTAVMKERADKVGAARNAATFKDTASIDKYSDQWYEKQREQVRKDKKDALANAGGDAKKAQDDYAEIEKAYNDLTKEFENRKKQWYDQVKSGKPVSVQEPVGGGVPDVQSDTGVAVPAGVDSKGRPLPAIPNAAAPVRGGAPAANPPATPQATPAAQPQLTPMQDKAVTIGGHTYKIGDAVRVKSTGEMKTIKGFAKGADGKPHATF